MTWTFEHNISNAGSGRGQDKGGRPFGPDRGGASSRGGGAFGPDRSFGQDRFPPGYNPGR